MNPKARKPKQKVHQLDTIPEQEEVEEPEEPEARHQHIVMNLQVNSNHRTA